jgi:hypothetical protein
LDERGAENAKFDVGDPHKPEALRLSVVKPFLTAYARISQPKAVIAHCGWPRSAKVLASTYRHEARRVIRLHQKRLKTGRSGRSV